MRIAFYAPLKPPDSKQPSGDLKMAQLLHKSMCINDHDVKLESRLRSWDSKGDANFQARLEAIGDRISDRLIHRYFSPGAWRPDIWFTYHLYYKAPDWIGPKISSKLSIPYVVAEASHAPKREHGKWKRNHQQVKAALHQADLVIGLNSRDRPCVEAVIGPQTKYETLRPFTDTFNNFIPLKASARKTLMLRHDLPDDTVWLLAVGMMRNDSKLESYRLLGAALKEIKNENNWRLIVVGDGVARMLVEETLPLQTIYAGMLSTQNLMAYYAAADIFVWPAINEAYGMALLEAQATGLPAISGDSGGVRDILRHGKTGVMCPEGDIESFSEAIETLVSSKNARSKMGYNARKIIESEHNFNDSAAKINILLTDVYKSLSSRK